MSTVPGSSDQMTGRLRVEEQFFDQFAAGETFRPARFYEWGLFRDAIESSRKSLGAVQGRQLLEYGCGLGHDTVFFASAGAHVLTFDLSDGMIREVTELVMQKGLDHLVRLHKMSGEALAFSDQSVDLVYGRSIVHHLDLRLAGKEIHRVLREGGKAAFLEPLGHNPFINFVRKFTPSWRTPTEKPLTTSDLEIFVEPFSSARVEGWCLLSLFALFFCYFLPSRRLFVFAVTRLGALDRWLLNRFPELWKFCWVAVIHLQK